MPEVTLEDVAARLADLERRFAEHTAAPERKKDCRRTVGMFAGNEFIRQLDCKCAAAREAERAARGEDTAP